MFLVYPQLPRAGLGNMLLVWARAVLFAHINSLPVVAPTWGKVRIGAYLRGERDKRYYGHLFCQENHHSKFSYFLTIFLKKNIRYNPDITKLDTSGLAPKFSECELF